MPRIAYRLLVVPLFIALVYLLVAGFAYAAWGLVWVIRHV